MKKVLIIILSLICLLGLVGCDPIPQWLDENSLLENTTKIELYYYENANPKLIHLYGKKKPTFDFSKATFVAALDEVHFEDLIKDIAEKECLPFPRVLNEPIGKTLILYQNDGNMIVLYSGAYKKGNAPEKHDGECYILDENGVFVEHIGYIGGDYVDTLELKYFNNNT